MSVSVNGRHVTCDGAGCLEQADVPIALRPLLSRDKATERINGWLFVARRGEWRHYCPACTALYLASHSDPPTLNH